MTLGMADAHAQCHGQGESGYGFLVVHNVWGRLKIVVDVMAEPSMPLLDTQQLAEVVKDVLADIKANGDEAVRKYESKFDHVELDSLKVRADEINEAEGLIDDELKNSLLTAYQNL